MTDAPTTEPEPEAAAPPRRLRAADVIAQQQDVIAMLTARGSSERSSVTLTRNAKGETQIEVVVRTDDTNVVTADDALEKARELYERATSLYPTANGWPRNEGQA